MESPHKEKHGLVHSLLEASSDSSVNVRKQVSKSLLVLAKDHTDFILSSIRKFLDNPLTTPKANIQGLLYNTAEDIIKEYFPKNVNSCDLEVWIEQSEQLLLLPTISVDLQQAASKFLVALGSTSYCDKVMGTLVEKMKSSEVPSESLLETIGALATSNSSGTACYFVQILESQRSKLVLVKQDNLRQAIASMFSKCSDSVIEAVANKNNEDTISIEDHHKICSEVYEVLMTQWLSSYNLVVKNEVILCLGHMSQLIPKEVLEHHACTLISSIISHYNYKRNPNPYALTFSLTLICGSIVKKDCCENIKVQVEPLLHSLFNQACVQIPNYSEPTTVRNHSEVLRCYEILAKNYPDLVVSHLIHKLENASYIQRVGSLLVLKHLINSRSMDSEKVENCVSVLLSLLSDPNSKVVKSLAQVIVALCHNKHLSAVSGQPFILYLVQHSAGGALTLRKGSLSELGEDTVGDVCCRALNILATTVSGAIPLLWPQLLQYVANVEYQSSLDTILSCLGHLSALPETLPLSGGGNPLATSGPTSAPYLITQLLNFCCLPSQSSCGQDALTLLQGLSKHISNKLDEVWSDHLPQLKLTFAELISNGPEPTDLQMWQDSLRDFLGCSILAINSDSFTNLLIKAQMDILELCNKNLAQRYFLISMVGVSLKYCRNKDTMNSTLDSLYSRTNHRSSAEQESFSLAVGYCSSIHIEVVLSHIETWLKATEVSRRSISFMSLLKSQDGRAEDAIHTRSCLVLCLGQIAVLAPPEKVGANIDGPIMLHLLNIMNSNKSDMVNDVVLQTTSKIARTLLRLPQFKLRQRPLLLTHVVHTIKQDNLKIAHMANALQVLRDLSALSPELDVEERTIVLQASFSTCLNILQKTHAINNSIQRCYSQLNVLIRTIIQHDTNPATLDDVTTLLHPWTVSSSHIVRAKSMDLLQSSFCTYLQHLQLNHTGPTTFNQTSQLVSMLTPRFADPVKEVRTRSISCLCLVLKIVGRYIGQAADYSDDDTTSLKALEEGINDIEMLDMSEPLLHIAKVLCNKLSFIQLRSYVSHVVIGLQDARPESAIGVAQILSAVFTLRGHQFHQHIKEILDSILGRLEKVSDFETRHHAIEAICNLSKHNINAIIDVLMVYPLPFESGVCETFQRIGCESEMCSSALVHISHVLERNQYFSEQNAGLQENVNIATLSTLAAVCSMKELLLRLGQNAMNETPDFRISSETQNLVLLNSQQVVIDKFPSLLALLLVSYGSYIGVIAPLHQSQTSNSNIAFVPNRGATSLTPYKCALEGIHALVSVADCENMMLYLNGELQNTTNDSFEEFIHSLSSIIALLVKEAPQHISSLVAYLDTHHNEEMQRVTVTTVFGELVAAKCCGDFELLEILTTGLLSRLNDKSVLVRRLAVRGLAKFAMLQNSQMGEKMNEVVGALVSATDLREGIEAVSEIQVTLEALKGLASIIPNLSQSITLAHTFTLLIRIRMFVEKTNPEIREASIGVLKGLSNSVGNSEEFQEQIHLHLLVALIHLQDSSPNVIIISKSTLQSMGPHLHSEQLNQLFQDHLNPSSSLNFHNFIIKAAKCVAVDMVDHIGLLLQAASSYFRHTEPSIRRAAVLLSCHVIFSSEVPVEPANVQRVSNGLHFLINDADQTVRTSAVLAIPLLQKYEAVL